MSFVTVPSDTLTDVFENNDFVRTIEITADELDTITSLDVKIVSNGIVIAPGTQKQIVLSSVIHSPTSATVTISGKFTNIFDQMVLQYVKDYLTQTYTVTKFTDLPQTNADIFNYTPDPRYSVTVTIQLFINQTVAATKSLTLNVLQDWSFNVPTLTSVVNNRGSNGI